MQCCSLGGAILNWITNYIDHYGYIVLLFSLMLELIAVPLPTEILMSYAGYLAFQGKLSFFLNILMAGLGSSIGMTIAYWIGFKLGTPFFFKFGHYIHMGPDRLEKVSNWFKKYGNKMILFAFFIPGVRHITGYFSGITRIPFRKYSLLAYTGAFLWVTVFISIGRILGPEWSKFHLYIKQYLIITGIFITIILFILFLYRYHKENIKHGIINTLHYSLDIFHSLRKVKLITIITAVIFLGLTIFMFGMIEDFLSNDFILFNEVTVFIISLIFHNEWLPFMQKVQFISSLHMILPIILFTFIWIWMKRTDLKLETGFLFLIIIGGELFKQVLQYSFQYIGHLKNIAGSTQLHFPGGQSLMVLVVYGVATYFLIIHSKNRVAKTFSPILFILLLVLVGLSKIYLEIQTPSDLLAGYVFGGVWLSLNTIIMEIFRLIKNEDF